MDLFRVTELQRRAIFLQELSLISDCLFAPVIYTSRKSGKTCEFMEESQG